MAYSGPKPFYPARFFHRLRTYPIKHCRTCNKQLTPKLITLRQSAQRLELLSHFTSRPYCEECEKQRQNKPKKRIVPDPQMGIKDRMLSVLADYRGMPLRPDDFREELGNQHTPYARLLEELVAAGLVGKKPDPDFSARSVYYALDHFQDAAA